MYDLLIKGGTVVTSDSIFHGDVAVQGEVIAALGSGLKARRVVDASGKLVIPGGIDPHVHLQMPIGKYCSTDDFFDGTRAAACGGTTTVIDFVEPNGGPMVEALEARRALAADKAVIDYCFHMTIGPQEMGRLDEVALAAQAGCGSFKMYMAYGLCLRDDQLYRAFRAVARAGGLPVIHAENWDIICAKIEENLALGNRSPHWHPRSRPREFEAEAVRRVCLIAASVGLPVHIFHVSCPEVMEEVVKARAQGIAVSAETCPQYLLLTRDLHDREGLAGALPVCSPPLRNESSRRALWQALKNGLFDIITTDHCPFTAEEKGSDLSAFNKIPGGVPSIEIRLSALYSEGVRNGLLSLNQWVDLCCGAPARLFGLHRKGGIAPGMDADIVVFDPEKKWVVSPDELHETAGWTPYEGLPLRGRPSMTLCRGKVIVDEGEFCGMPGGGRFTKSGLRT